MRVSRFLVSAFLALSIVAGCGGTDRVCVPGITQVCLCPGSITGAQSCNAGGTGFEACVCPGTDDGNPADPGLDVQEVEDLRDIPRQDPVGDPAPDPDDGLADGTAEDAVDVAADHNGFDLADAGADSVDPGNDVFTDSFLDPGTDPVTPPEDSAAADQDGFDSDRDVAPDAAADADVIADPGFDIVTPPVPFGAANRGYKELRGVVHMHSNWSHDGCFPQQQGLSPALLTACETEHRAAPCQTGMDFVMQTDHPANVSQATFQQALHYRADEGDALLIDAKGRMTANKVTCPDGSIVPSFLYFVGTEGNSSMPIGLSSPVPDEVWHTSYDAATPLADAQAAIAKVHEMGGYAFGCHPEQGDLSVQTIKALPLDGIELFNFHPMLMEALGEGFEQFLRVDSFMNLGRTNPIPDLAILLLMKPVANDPQKFDASTPYIRLSGFGATDIHRSLAVPSLCMDLESCGNTTADYPNFAQLLVTGGPVMLADGMRMDSFQRSFRWMSNHTLVQADKAGDVDEVRRSIGLGRSFLAFDLLGMPKGFDFFAVADGLPVEMGTEVRGAASVTLYLKTPVLAKTPWTLPDFPTWVEGQSNCSMRTKVFKATPAGVDLVRDVAGEGRDVEVPVVDPGAYRVEVWVTPRHLRPGLKGVEDLADKEVPYLYSNAIFVR